MLWKSAATVGFGYAGPYVVARYCADLTASPLSKYPVPPKEADVVAYGFNVCKVGGCA
jgi:hypothetical protein